jgi:hypothetical protein
MQQLQGHQYINLTTYRKSGDAVTTPVWFAEEGGKLYVYTSAAAGKVKRIRNNGKVEIGPCTASGKSLGASVAAQARILPEADGRHADQLLTQKYGLLKRLITWVNGLRGGKPAYLEISLAEASG